MKCPRCGGLTRQLQTQGNRRARKCGSCGIRFFTVEMPESDFEREAVKVMRQLLDQFSVKRARATLREKGYLR